MAEENVVRNYKDSLFRMVFREKAELLSLYNAMNGTSYDDPEDLTVTTIEIVLYMGLKNDISFLIEDVMNLYEGQGSWNPNMPLRGLFYFSMIYQGYIRQNQLDIYSSTLLKLPSPRYVVFYNGLKEEPDRQDLKLSDSFIKTDGSPCLECTAQVININFGRNEELMEACRKLHEYAYFVEKVREYLKEGLTLEASIDQAVVHCINENILKEFLEKHRGEVKNVILTEYDEKLHSKTLYEEGKAAGIQEGRTVGIQEGRAIGIQEGRTAGIQEGKAAGIQEGLAVGLQEALLHYISCSGQVSAQLKDRISRETDPDVVKKWLDTAFGGSSLKELEKEILKD